MKKALAIGSLSVVIVLVLAGFTPVFASKPQRVHTELVPIEVTKYTQGRTIQSRTLVTPAAAEQIKVLLSELSVALDHRDSSTVADCIKTLEGYGITFGQQYQSLMPLQGIVSRHSSSLPHLTPAGPDANLSNTACIFSAHGEGMLAGYFAEQFIQSVSEILHNVTNPITGLILLLVFLPLIVVVLFFNDLIPIRIMMPHGTLVLANGTISSLGAQGAKRETIGANHAQVNLSGFTGISLNILPMNGRKAFTFVFGFAMKTEGYIAS